MEPRRKTRARALLFVALLVNLVAIAVFVGAILIGEATRLTSLALYAPRHHLLLMAVAGGLAAPLTRRRVRSLVIVHVVAGLFVLFPVMGFNVAFPREREGADVVRLATWNVYFGKLGRPELMEEIASMDVDVLLLQAPYESLASRLKERFPDRTVHGFEDFILVSRLPVKEILTPKPLDGDLSPMFVSYVVETPRGRVGLYNVHPFSPRHALFGDVEHGENAGAREAQIAAALGAARADGPPFLVVGDTNLPELSAIKRRNFSGLKDAWSEVGLGFGYTFPAKRPWMRIDRALASEGIRFLDARVGARGASDHRPLFVDFELERSTPTP